MGRCSAAVKHSNSSACSCVLRVVVFLSLLFCFLFLCSCGLLFVGCGWLWLFSFCARWRVSQLQSLLCSPTVRGRYKSDLKPELGPDGSHREPPGCQNNALSTYVVVNWVCLSRGCSCGRSTTACVPLLAFRTAALAPTLSSLTMPNLCVLLTCPLHTALRSPARFRAGPQD